MRTIAILTTICLLTATLAYQADARPTRRPDKGTQSCRIFQDGQAEWDTRKWGKGGKLFQENCKSCHTRKNDFGAPYLWEESKTSRGWNRVFYKKYPQCAKNGAWADMNLEQQLILNDYLYRWSKDAMDINDNC